MHLHLGQKAWSIWFSHEVSRFQLFLLEHSLCSRNSHRIKGEEERKKTRGKFDENFTKTYQIVLHFSPKLSIHRHFNAIVGASGQILLRTVGRAEHICCFCNTDFFIYFNKINWVFWLLRAPCGKGIVAVACLTWGFTDWGHWYLSSTIIIPGLYLPFPTTHPVIFFFKISKTQKRLCTKDSLLHPETHTSPQELKHLMEWWRLIDSSFNIWVKKIPYNSLLGSFSTFFFICLFVLSFLFFFFMLGKSGPWSAYPVRCREFSLMCAEVQWQTLTT